jgi:membrane protein involved in colicin uptake
MKYWNEYTQKLYENANDCLVAERKFVEKQNQEKIEKERKAAERKAAAEKVDAARKAMEDAQSNYKKELEAFCKAYGTYHYSTNSADDIPHLFDIFSLFS